MKINIIEIEMLKYLNKRKHVSQRRLRLNFPICFNKITGSLYNKGMITQTYAEDDEMFLPGTLIMMPGNGDFIITSEGQKFLNEWKKTIFSKIWDAIKFVICAIVTVLITNIINSLH